MSSQEVAKILGIARKPFCATCDVNMAGGSLSKETLGKNHCQELLRSCRGQADESQVASRAPPPRLRRRSDDDCAIEAASPQSCATVSTVMNPKVVSISQGPRVPRRPLISLGNSVLYVTLPDEETLRFWKATADSAREFAVRVALFSRRMQEWKIVTGTIEKRDAVSARAKVARRPQQ